MRRVSISEIGRTIASLVGGGIQPTFSALPDRPGEVTPVADIETSMKLLNWRPGVFLERGLKRTIEWYRRKMALMSNNEKG